MNVTITGAGIAGLTTAIALERIGIKATIFEATPVIKPLGAGIVLAANAMRALQKIGIADDIIARGRQLSAFSIYEKNGRLINRTDSTAMSAKYGLDNFAIHRAALQEVLLLKTGNKNIYTGRRAVAAEQSDDKIILAFEDGSTHETDLLIVADGIHSVIRKQLVPSSINRYAGYTCWRAVIKTNSLQLTESAETWGKEGRFGMVQLAEDMIYWFACINASPNDRDIKNFTVRDLQNKFKDFHDPIPDVLSLTKNEDLIWNDIIDIKPINQFAFGNIVLTGDAAHATTPNLGQGACQAIEDAVILADELHKNPDTRVALKQFEKRRVSKTHYITNTSWMLGKLAQFENSFGITLRNFLLRSLPASVNEKQIRKIYKVDF